jgi:imidazolonepropionase-like amidohydrolase
VRHFVPMLACVGSRVIALATFFAAALPAQSTVIRAGQLLDPISGSVLRDRYILVENGRIRSVGTNMPVAKDAHVIDLSHLTVMPGMIDAHVHLVIGGPVRTNAAAILNAGFTTVVDLGARTTRLLRIRDSINAGYIPGPRVLAAGMWVGTKNGVCEFNGLGIAGGLDAFRARVRENVDAGADVIKVCVSGWPAESFANPDSFEIAPAALEAVVNEAREHKHVVLAHAISRGAAAQALRSGVAGLAHAAFLDTTTARLMAQHNVFLIPTLASLTAGDTSAVARALVAGTALAYQSGVRIVFGTDGGVLPHGRNAEEFTALRRAGIPNGDAIRAATSTAASVFSLIDSIGVVSPGRVADIIAVEGNPLTDLDALTRVRFVMSRGRVVSR